MKGMKIKEKQPLEASASLCIVINLNDIKFSKWIPSEHNFYWM